MKNIAVVILNWNGKKLLEEFLPLVVKYSPEATIYIADNASTDESVLYIQQRFPAVTVILNSENYGYAGGYNQALKNINEDYYVLLNSDIEVTEGWLHPVVELFERNMSTAIVQPKLLDYYNKDYFEYAGAAGGYIDKYGYPFCRGRIFDTLEIDKAQYDDETELFWASGACFIIRSSVFWKLNGFDEDFFAHQEEIDLCWRAFNEGYNIQFCANSVVYHMGGATLKTSSPQKTFLNFRNSLWLLLKNLPSGKLIPVIFTRMILDGIAGFRFLFKGKFAHFFAILKAHFFCYTSAARMLKKRGSNQRQDYYLNKSIVYDYYIKGCKIFTDKFNNSL